MKIGLEGFIEVSGDYFCMGVFIKDFGPKSLVYLWTLDEALQESCEMFYAVKWFMHTSVNVCVHRQEDKYYLLRA